MSLLQALALMKAPDLLETVKAGRPLSEALTDPYERGIVRIGEETGRLDRAFGELHRALEERRRQRDEFRSRMMYPIVVLHAVILIPPIVMLVTSGPLAYVKAVAPALTVVYGAYAFLRRRPPWLPIVGPYARALNLARFLRALAFLWDAGVPLARAFDLAATVGIRVDYRPGATLRETLEASGRFSPMVLGAVEVGETSGDVDGTLRKAAEVLEQEARGRLDVALRLLPLAAILLLGAVTALIAIGRFSALYR